MHYFIVSKPVKVESGEFFFFCFVCLLNLLMNILLFLVGFLPSPCELKVSSSYYYIPFGWVSTARRLWLYGLHNCIQV